MTEYPGRPPEGDWLGTPHLRFERHGAFAHCTIDRPERRNAMTAAMYFGIRVAIRRVEQDDDLAGLLITGTGDVFCPGGDLSQTSDDRWMDLEGIMHIENTPFDALRQARKPVVSAVNGLCQGGGLVMAMLSDVAVVSEQSTFRVPELYRGIADTNYAHLLPRHIGVARARDLMLTGRQLSAAEAVEWGLVTRVAPQDRVVAEATDVLAACARTAPGARMDVKASFDRTYGLYDRISMSSSMYGDEPVEGFESFKERRSPSWVHPDLRRDGRL